MSFFELFQPGFRHLREERDRQKSPHAYPTGEGGSPLGIDLSGGTARFAMPATPDNGEAETATDDGLEVDAQVELRSASAGDDPEPAAAPVHKAEDAPEPASAPVTKADDAAEPTTQLIKRRRNPRADCP